MTPGSLLLLVAVLMVVLGAISLGLSIRRRGLGAEEAPVAAGSPDDEFGGLADYPQRAESRITQAGYWLRRSGNLLLATITGAIIARCTAVLWWPVDSTRPLDRIAATISVVLAFLFAGSLAYLIQMRLRPTATERYSFYGTALMMLLVSFVPLHGKPVVPQAASVVEPETLAQVAASTDELRARVGSKWLDDLFAAGAHGQPGVEPPFLEVDDEGDSVTVLNISGRPIDCLYLQRVKVSESSGEVELTCELILKHSTHSCAPLPNGYSRQLVLPKEADPQCKSLPLEFRVGDMGHPDPSYWSDSALRLRYPREDERQRPRE